MALTMIFPPVELSLLSFSTPIWIQIFSNMNGSSLWKERGCKVKGIIGEWENRLNGAIGEKRPIPEVIKGQSILIFQNIGEKVLLRSSCWFFLSIPSLAPKISSVDNLLVPRIPTISGSSQRLDKRREEPSARFPPGVKVALVATKACQNRSSAHALSYRRSFGNWFSNRVFFVLLGIYFLKDGFRISVCRIFMEGGGTEQKGGQYFNWHGLKVYFVCIEFAHFRIYCGDLSQHTQPSFYVVYT